MTPDDSAPSEPVSATDSTDSANAGFLWLIRADNDRRSDVETVQRQEKFIKRERWRRSDLKVELRHPG